MSEHPRLYTVIALFARRVLVMGAVKARGAEALKLAARALAEGLRIRNDLGFPSLVWTLASSLFIYAGAFWREATPLGCYTCSIGFNSPD